MHKPPSLVCMKPNVAATSIYHNWAYHGGQHRRLPLAPRPLPPYFVCDPAARCCCCFTLCRRLRRCLRPPRSREVAVALAAAPLLDDIRTNATAAAQSTRKNFARKVSMILHRRLEELVTASGARLPVDAVRLPTPWCAEESFSH